MIDRTHTLPVAQQARLLGLSRSSLYYQPCPVSAEDLAVMRRIDELHLELPFAGSRMLRDLLRGEGIEVGREAVRTMMKRMGIAAIYRRPNTSKPAPGHRIYPYLLRSLVVDRPNQVWAMDITYIPMARGFVYLSAVVALRQAQEVHAQGPGVAAVDHHGRRILPRGGRGSLGAPWQARGLQHGPG
jgi:putative transposase